MGIIAPLPDFRDRSSPGGAVGTMGTGKETSYPWALKFGYVCASRWLTSGLGWRLATANPDRRAPSNGAGQGDSPGAPGPSEGTEKGPYAGTHRAVTAQRV